MNKKQKLTSKQKQVLKFIYDSIKVDNLPPTVREIASHFNFSSTGTVRDYLKALVRKGYIRIKANKSRAIELVRVRGRRHWQRVGVQIHADIIGRNRT